VVTFVSLLLLFGIVVLATGSLVYFYGFFHPVR
jgi:hypothetical protein